ncbi:hypothetical protein IQ223_05390 [Microcystis aeruginosa LEGE 00239]|nr:hypothetical protein [Microcystis aeruginosa]MBE9243998.1 hypothetical protein [Microcystis aeruginosa LEGE 00239]
MKIQGIIKGNTIELLEDLSLPKGLPENKIPNKKIEKCFFEKVIIFV